MKTCFLVMAFGPRRMSCTTPLALSVLAGLLACSTPGDPVAKADGSFTITRQSDTQNATPRSQITAMATQDAEAHCLKIGKKFRPIQTKEIITRGAPLSEVHYACD